MSAREDRERAALAWESGPSSSTTCACGGERWPSMVAPPHPGRTAKHDCTPACDRPGYVCRRCRLWTPAKINN